METRLAMTGGELQHLLGAWQGGGPGYEALAGALRSLVLDGRLPVRVRLPSEREMAAALGVSRTTTAAAYDLLRGEGFVESRRGSGSRVALPTGGAVDRELGPSRASASAPAGDAIDLTIAALPAPGATMEAVARATRDLAGCLGGTGYEPRGLASFRRAVARHFDERGLPTDPDQIVVTAGAQHALALLLDVLVAPGDPVLVEEPTYPNALEAMRRAGVRFLPAPVAERGWDVETIAARFREGVPRLAYLIPDFQNPTGFLMGDAERAVVVAAAGRAGTHLVVDETFALLDLEPWRRMPSPMAAQDEGVITVGSMSKAFWGGLRVGWIRCVEPLARRLSRARAAVDLASPALEQLVAQHLLGASGAVLTERRALLTTRRDALVAALGRDLPGWQFTVPRGGLCLWAELERPEAEALAEAAQAEGVRIVPGPTFGVGGTLDRRVRLPFTQPRDLLEEAVGRLAAAGRRLRAGAPPPASRWIA
ncbi:MAG: PLP-dependent aminotransferase family protein [Actinomycetota bacterium]